MKRLWQVVGNHPVDGVAPGDTFEADLEPGHPWLVGGHVAAARKPEPDPEPAAEA